MTRRKDPVDTAIDILWQWERGKGHALKKIRRLSRDQWITECRNCNRQFHISMTENGVVMDLDDQTCTRREAADDEQRPL